MRKMVYQKSVRDGGDGREVGGGRRMVVFLPKLSSSSDVLVDAVCLDFSMCCM